MSDVIVVGWGSKLVDQSLDEILVKTFFFWCQRPVSQRLLEEAYTAMGFLW